MEILNLSFLSLIISLTALEYHNSGRDHFKCKSPALVYRYKLAVPWSLTKAAHLKLLYEKETYQLSKLKQKSDQTKNAELRLDLNVTIYELILD